MLLVFMVLFSVSEVTALEKDRSYYESKGQVIWDYPTDQPVICLTFDDGPDPTYTLDIAQILEKYGARGTFFVTGKQVELEPGLIHDLFEKKHEIANHSYSHREMNRLNEEQIKEEVIKTGDLIYQEIGIKPTLFRPPGGVFNERVVNLTTELGYMTVMWSWHQDTRDWDSNTYAGRIINQVITNARNGDIVLFHDFGGSRNNTIQALESIIPTLKKEGYSFITVSELLEVRMNDLMNGR
ncbi:hypothetical protein AB990_04880 [Alkalihalobacillus pseudalcaliphilus]|nr:hypothetical protein AB990_04880 [Alkalihalobacillus pseudalcaliphilus]